MKKGPQNSCLGYFPGNEILPSNVGIISMHHFFGSLMNNGHPPVRCLTKKTSDEKKRDSNH